ncbi:hypothetical protein HU200_062249 [Digitaria exilis]|uniref:Uncharacterized protein n=1 Tax=Digitaria exilis TaxID=1010633 RepID=A0A835A7B3_9POAL|nr:hypothetical protein HU200_062249 [Digitaria exilis]
MMYTISILSATGSILLQEWNKDFCALNIYTAEASTNIFMMNPVDLIGTHVTK